MSSPFPKGSKHVYRLLSGGLNLRKIYHSHLNQSSHGFFNIAKQFEPVWNHLEILKPSSRLLWQKIDDDFPLFSHWFPQLVVGILRRSWGPPWDPQGPEPAWASCCAGFEPYLTSHDKPRAIAIRSAKRRDAMGDDLPVIAMACHGNRKSPAKMELWMETSSINWIFNWGSFFCHAWFKLRVNQPTVGFQGEK